MLSKTILLLTFLISTFVNGEISNNNCPPFCKDKHLSELKSFLCPGNCLPSVKQTLPNNKCLDDCILKNPEASEICSFNCKLQKKDVPVVDIKAPENVKKPEENEDDEGFLPLQSSSLDTGLMKMQSFMDNLLNHIMDGAQHQRQFGAFSSNGHFDKVFKGLDGPNDDEKNDAGIFTNKINNIPGKDGSLEVRKLGGDSVEDKEEEKSPEKDDVLPVMHRFIIIKRVPFFSIFNHSPRIADERKIEKSENEVSQSKMTSFFTVRKQDRCAWKRSVMLLLSCMLFIISTWFCTARFFAYRTRCIQDKMLRSATDDFKYMVHIDEDMMFFDSKEKEALGEQVVAPPPYKPNPVDQNVAPVHHA